MFDRLIWKPDRMLLDDLVFLLGHYRSESWGGGEYFIFYKIKDLVDQYEDFFRCRPDFHPKHVMELGTFDGGSVAFWFELFQPQKHVAVDLMDREDSPYFRRYVESHGLSDRIKTFWKTDQADKTRLREITAAEFDGPLDLVIDDASHFNEPTRASFEVLFPLLAPGGLYIVEDWAWGHWPEFIAPDHPWAGEEPPAKFVSDLIEAAGTSTQLIRNVTVYQGFVSVERGSQIIDDVASFHLDDHIVRRPKQNQFTRMFQLSSRTIRLLATKVRSRLTI